MSNKKKILIVDDDDDLRRGLNIRLRAAGYEPVFATDGIMAIAQAQKLEPDLILLDIGLPAGDGYVVLERLRVNPKLALIPVVIVSARDPAGSRPKALRLGAAAFIQKPVENEELLRVISAAMSAPGSAAEEMTGAS
jgi:DNA-binding response OmpR family regulator